MPLQPLLCARPGTPAHRRRLHHSPLPPAGPDGAPGCAAHCPQAAGVPGTRRHLCQAHPAGHSHLPAHHARIPHPRRTEEHRQKPAHLRAKLPCAARRLPPLPHGRRAPQQPPPPAEHGQRHVPHSRRRTSNPTATWSSTLAPPSRCSPSWTPIATTNPWH